jgi:hypothetical protein
MGEASAKQGRRVVAVILDGLRRDLVQPDLTPTLWELRKRATWFDAHTSVFPSCTRVVSSSFATGCFPANHGLAGNTVCLIENGRLALHDVGKPEFLENKRRLTGIVLAQPTLAERLAPNGGAIIFNNVSPGAAYMHDPDGHGYVYHRAGSFGPGRTPILGDGELRVTGDSEGDAAAAQRFAAEIVRERRPSFALLWLCQPDTAQHGVPLGSPKHREALAQADLLVRTVLDEVEACRARGEDVLFVVGSDHGHQTISEGIDISAELVAAGLKEDLHSSDVMVAANGTAALIYVDAAKTDLVPALGEFLRSRRWAGKVFGEDALGEVHLPPGGGLSFAVAMAASEDVNEFGIPGRSYTALTPGGKPAKVGCGQHGGLGRFEQSPFLMIEGDGFLAEAIVTDPTSAVDIAPTVLQFLGQHTDGMDGRPLQFN